MADAIASTTRLAAARDMRAAVQWPMSSRSRLALSLVALLIAAIAGVAPFRAVLGHWPIGVDALKWTTHAHPETEGWASWVFLENHFIGYRPVNALTFSLNGALTGWEPWGWGATDLLCHALAGVGVWAAWWTLARGRAPFGSPAERERRSRAPEWGVLAAVLFWAHPVGQAVVPHLARRSYSLSEVLCLLAVAMFAVAARRRWTATLPAAVVFLLSILANETAYVMVPVFALLAFALVAGPGARPDLRAALARAAPFVVAAAVALAMRLMVLGRLGGYDVARTAEVEDGQRMVIQGGTPLAIFGRAIEFAFFPESPSGDPSFVLAWSAGGAVVAAAIVAWMVLVSAWLAWRRDPLPLVYLVWAAGYAALAAVTEAWYPRIAYPMAAPLALWLVHLLVVLIEALRERRPAAVQLVLLAVLLASLAQWATPIRGLDQAPIRGHFRSSRLIRQALRTLGDMEGPALVWVALPIRGVNVESTLHWIRRDAAERDVQVRLLATAVAGQRTRPADAFEERVALDGREGIAPVDDMEWTGEIRALFGLANAHAPLASKRLLLDGRPTWLLDLEEGRPSLRELPRDQSGQ